MDLTIHLLRHGRTQPETPWRFLGQRDVPLSEAGRAQACEWNTTLASIPFQSAWCSDLNRCRETAEIVLAGRGLSVQPLVGLRELNLGKWEGLTREEVKQRFPGQFEARGQDLAGYRPESGEGFADLQVRVWAALEMIIGSSSGHILVVGHAGTNRALISKVLGLPLSHLFRLGQDYGCRNILEWREGEMRLALLNEQPTPQKQNARLK